MIGTQNLLAVLGIGGLALFGATACNVSFSFDEDGSGVPQTVTYEFDSFDEVDVDGVFDAEITVVEGPPTVEITVDDNLVDRLEVEVDDGELNIDMKGSVDFGVDPTVIITMPELVELDVSGAATAVVIGAETSDLKIDLSGASDVEIDMNVTTLVIDGSGASTMMLEGTAGDVEMDLSGASSVDMDQLEVDTATVDMSGSSEASFGDVATVNGDLSGASLLTVPDSASVSVETSSGAMIDRS